MSDSYEVYRHLRLEGPEDGILTIIMDNPGRLNAATEGMHADLADIWQAVDADPDVNCAIITGAGEAFSAGAEFEVVERITEDFDFRARLWREARDLVYNIVNCSTPIVSAMRGPAVGAGLVAGLLADVSIVSRTARIIDGHTRLGVAAGDHAAIVWPLLIGMAKAKYHLLLCEPIDGEEAERLGLVSLCVDDSELDAKAREIARRLADMPPTAVKWTKYALNNWLRMAGPGFDASLALEFLGFTGPDVREGIAAIKEKRKPAFSRRSPF